MTEVNKQLPTGKKKKPKSILGHSYLHCQPPHWECVKTYQLGDRQIPL